MGILSLNDNGFEAFVRDGPSENSDTTLIYSASQHGCHGIQMAMKLSL